MKYDIINKSNAELSSVLSYLLSGFPPKIPPMMVSLYSGLLPQWPYHMQYPSATETIVDAATTSSATNDTCEFILITFTYHVSTVPPNCTVLCIVKILPLDSATKCNGCLGLPRPKWLI